VFLFWVGLAVPKLCKRHSCIVEPNHRVAARVDINHEGI